MRSLLGMKTLGSDNWRLEKSGGGGGGGGGWWLILVVKSGVSRVEGKAKKM